MEELHPAAAIADAQHGRRQALRHLAAVGPNTLLYNTKAVQPAPTSWSAIYSPKYKGEVTVRPTRSRSQTPPCICRRRSRASASRSLRADRSAAQRRRQPAQTAAPADQEVWALASDEIELFKNGDVAIGAAWPYQYSTLLADKSPSSS